MIYFCFARKNWSMYTLQFGIFGISQNDESGNIWVFHPILLISFLVVFSDKVIKISCNSLFIFHFVLPILPCKRKTSYRKSRNLSDEKPKMKLPKYVMSQAVEVSCQKIGKKVLTSWWILPLLYFMVQNKFRKSIHTDSWSRYER